MATKLRDVPTVEDAPLPSRIDYLPPEEIEEAEVAAYDILRDAKYLSCAPREAIQHNQEWLEEARELLNDALARC